MYKSDALLDSYYGSTASVGLLQEMLGWPEPAGPCCVGLGRTQVYPVTYRPEVKSDFVFNVFCFLFKM